MPGVFFGCGRRTQKHVSTPVPFVSKGNQTGVWPVASALLDRSPLSSHRQAWSFRCLHADGISPESLSAIPAVNVCVDLHSAPLLLGRSTKPIEDLLAVCPENAKYLSRNHVEIKVVQIGPSTYAQVTNLSDNFIYIDKKCLRKGSSRFIANSQMLSFAKPSENGISEFIVFQAIGPCSGFEDADFDDAMTFVRLSDDASVGGRLPKAFKKWRFQSTAARGISVQHMPLNKRTLELVDGTALIGRRHQAEFFTDMLAGAPENQQFVSRTHAELSIRTTNGHGELLVTNRAANVIFVGDQPVTKGEFAVWGRGRHLSFVKPGKSPDDAPEVLLQIEALDLEHGDGDHPDPVGAENTVVINADAVFTGFHDASRFSSDKTQPPLSIRDIGKEDAFTMVFTDVQGSTSLWEADPEAMETALSLHDDTVRKILARNHGYEVTTEGDAFQLAFHDAFDAVRFCLECQVELLSCDWPVKTLQHPDAAPSEDGVWRGLRVRMGVHSGRPAAVTEHEVTGRLRYAGPNVAMAKAVESVCHGGQIVLSGSSFNLINSFLIQLGGPQVLDLGEHVLENAGFNGDARQQTVTCSLFQLLPVCLAHDFGRDSPHTCFPRKPTGRLLPPIISLQQTALGFHQAPCGSEIVVCFAFAHCAKSLCASVPKMAADALGLLRNCVRESLRDAAATGYECQEDEGAFMLVFGSIADGAAFAETLQLALPKLAWSEELTACCDPKFDQGLRMAIGMFTGGYTSRKPHFSTGRADYFGTIVNRAARIAASAHPGQVLIGEEGHANLTTADVCNRGLETVGKFVFKGIACPQVIHELRIPDGEGRFPYFPPLKARRVEMDDEVVA